MGSEKLFIVEGRTFIYIMKRKGPKIGTWGAPCFTVPHFEQNFSKDFNSIFFLFFMCQDMNQLATVP
jgi:hypothetical protein